jgi:hypothetical protein
MVKYEHLINVDILKRLKKYTVYINCLNVIFFFDFYNSMLSAVINHILLLPPPQVTLYCFVNRFSTLICFVL